MNRCLVLTFKEANGISHFGHESGQGIPANFRHPRVARLDHQVGRMHIERAVGSERLGKMFAAIVEGAGEGEFAVAPDQNGTLQVPHIE